jgi:hypothetical protein
MKQTYDYYTKRMEDLYQKTLPIQQMLNENGYVDRLKETSEDKKLLKEWQGINLDIELTRLDREHYYPFGK